MKFRHVLTYDAPPAEVYAMLADPAFREKVCAAQEVVSHDLTLTPTGDGFELVMHQVQNTAGLPAIAKKIAGDTTEVTLQESWRDPTGGTLEIITPGKPTGASGTIALAADGAGTTETVELEIKVKVPLIGGKLESLMADNVRSGMDVEQTVGAAWLAGSR
ncbi:DUF2505 domain-containing protein [Nocardioides rubriscoriae]|uniref:DUF2505 domain-containing protein n=1 Tax=Nocardioides rubriscoriae TaxID=642762 RepID=UPI0011DF5B6E|nr:DUF2505 domain-containing protein [Nocardioides rubriscoriae]